MALSTERQTAGRGTCLKAENIRFLRLLAHDTRPCEHYCKRLAKVEWCETTVCWTITEDASCVQENSSANTNLGRGFSYKYKVRRSRTARVED